MRKNKSLKDFPLLLKDWNYEKNSPLDPLKLTSGSNRKVFWKCSKCGYEWQSTISNRASGRGCACCSHRVLVPGINDLLTLYPELAKEWHPNKNGNLKSSDVLPGRNKSVWWLCPNGHEYLASPNHRTFKNGTNCPICNRGKQTSFREQALFFYVKKMYPDAISGYKSKELGRFELDIFIPEFNIGIEYDGAAWHKQESFDRELRKYHLCQKAGIMLIRVKEKMPEEFGLDIADYMISGGNFETEEGLTDVIHDVLDRIDFANIYRLHPLDVNITRDRYEILHYMVNIKCSFGESRPDLAKEWHPTKNKNMSPTMFKPHSQFKAWWLCPICGCEYEKSIKNRNNGGGCPNCQAKYNGLTLRMNLVRKNGGISKPILLREWNYKRNGEKRPENYTRASDDKVWWICSKCGYEWESKISNREHGRGCPRCDGKLFIKGENDLATMCPDLIKDWDYSKNIGIDPANIHYGSTSVVWWKCSKCGHEWRAPIARRKNGAGCRKCADKINGSNRRAQSVAKNGSLGEQYPELIKEFSKDNEVLIFEIAPSSHVPVKWVCSTCGYQWTATPYTRIKGHGCRMCSYKKSVQNRKK